MKKPKELRKGQNLINFIDWYKNHVETKFGKDLFFISDEDFDKVYKVYLKR